MGYDVAAVSETAAMMAALKARRPYAVVIDRKMGSAATGRVAQASRRSNPNPISRTPSFSTSAVPASRPEYRR